MNLYIKQRVFSIGDQYDIYDEYGKPIFHVAGKIFTIMAKLSLFDLAGNELFLIRRRFSFPLARYEIYRGPDLFATVVQEFRFFKPKLRIESMQGTITIEGDFWSMHYDLFRNGYLMGSIRKKWFSWGDSYELVTANGEDPAFFCAIVIAVDNCIHNENRNN